MNVGSGKSGKTPPSEEWGNCTHSVRPQTSIIGINKMLPMPAQSHFRRSAVRTCPPRQFLRVIVPCLDSVEHLVAKFQYTHDIRRKPDVGRQQGSAENRTDA